jgi:hypothetical protein
VPRHELAVHGARERGLYSDSGGVGSAGVSTTDVGGAGMSAAGGDGGECLSMERGGDGGRGELEWLLRVNSRLTLAVAWNVPARAAGVRHAAAVECDGRGSGGNGDGRRVP